MKRTTPSPARDRLRRLGRLGALAACAVAPVAIGSAAAAEETVSLNAAPDSGIDDAEIEQAKVGVRSYLIDSVLNDHTAECPVVRQDQVGYWMGQLGMAGTSEGYEIGQLTVDGVDAFGIYCGVNPNDFVDSADPNAPFALGLEAFELYGDHTLGEFMEGHVGGNLGGTSPVADQNLGGEVAVQCGTPGRAVCIALWHRSGLVVDLLVTGPAGQLDAERSQQLLLSMIPDAVTNLGATANQLGGATTTAAPNTAPSTAPATTPAPAPTPAPTAAPTTAPPTTKPSVAPTTAAPAATTTAPPTAPGKTVPNG